MHTFLFIFYFLLVGHSQVYNQATQATNSTAQTQNTTLTTIVSTTVTSAPKVEPVLECKLNKSSNYEKKLLEKLNKLKGLKFTWDDPDHRYYFSICSTAENAPQSDVGFVQINKNMNKTFVLGRLDDVDLEGTSNMIRLVYKNGDKYAHACKQAERTAVIYFFCNPSATQDAFRMVEENNERDEDCAYVFELSTAKICDSNNTPSSTASSITSSTASSNAPINTTASPAAPASSTSNNTPSKSKLGFFSIFSIV